MGSATGTLQSATVIAKTTQTIVGSVIGCRGYDYLTLFLTYTKGDETGLLLKPWGVDVAGTAYQVPIWTATAGAYAQALSSYTFAATTSTYITFDVRGLDYFKLTQGGSNNDGTPTGTLAVSYLLKGEM